MQVMPKPALIWFRQDLRLADNPALHAVADRPILPVFILDPDAAGGWAEGGAGLSARRKSWRNQTRAGLDITRM